MADRETLHSGPPEVLAKYIASQFKRLETIINPICGSRSIAIQLAMVGRKVIAMDLDPAKVKCAQNNARVYGVADRIQFIVGDIFEIWNTPERADGIVTSPPEALGKQKTADLIKICSRLSPKLLFKLPVNRDKDVLYRIGSSHFQRIKMETISIDRQLTCINIYLGPVTNNYNVTNVTNEAADRVETDELLFRDGVAVNRRVDWIRGNNLFAHDEYLHRVDNFLK